jgi:DegV family protein with EDD domain
MRDYVIVTDADSEMPWKVAEEAGVPVFEMPFTFEGVEYNYDLGKEVVIPGFFEKLGDGADVTTSCRPPWEIKDFFKQYLDQGMDVLYIGFSNALSNHHSNCQLAKRELDEEYPDATIELIDTLSISLGLSQLVVEAAKLKQSGSDLETVANWVRTNIPHSLVFFMVDDLNYLKRGGRLSGASAFFGTVLDIKPILHTSDDGKLEPIEKIKGKKKAMRRLVELANERAVDMQNSTIYITATDPEDGLALKKLLESNAEFANIEVWEVGPVIGGHTGPGTMGLGFFGTKR